MVNETITMCHLDNNRCALMTNTRARTQQHRSVFESPATTALKCAAPSVRVRSRSSAVSAANCIGFLPRRTNRECISALSLKLKQKYEIHLL